MIILSSLLSDTCTWRTYLQDSYQLAQIFGTAMLIIYVIYTYKSFRQIKRQTDYQQDAYLSIETKILNDSPVLPTTENQNKIINRQYYNQQNYFSISKYIDYELSRRMKDILKPFFKFEDNIYEGNFYSIILKNHGNADVSKVIVTLSITVKNSQELIEKKMLRPSEQRSKKVVINEIVARNGGTIQIPLLPTASFPIYSIITHYEYYDIRNKKYTHPSTEYSGENPHLQKLPEQ